jgi:nicotinamide-nucleotide amidase
MGLFIDRHMDRDMDLQSLAHAAAANLIKLKQSVSVAESSTGGLISASLLAIAGASQYYAGGSVIYTRASRKRFLSLDPLLLKDLAPLSEEMVIVFAEAAKDSLDASWGLAELGAAGPTGTPYGHPPGVSVIGVSGPVNLSTRIETNSADRNQNMWRFTEAALQLLTQATAQALKARD